MEKISFKEKLDVRIKEDEVNFWTKQLLQKAYFIGAYSKAVINGSWNSEVSKHNETFKKWLSNQIINGKNLDRIFEIAFRFEQKLKLRIRNDTEVRRCKWQVKMHLARKIKMHLLVSFKKWFTPPLLVEF